MARRFADLNTEDGRARFRWIVSRKVSRLIYRFGFVLLSDYFYQPVPRRQDLLGHRQPCRLIETTLDQQASFAGEVLGRYGHEFGAYLSEFGYVTNVGQLPTVDASMLYAVVRHAKPKRIVEVGSGGSTKVIAAALQRNATLDDRSCTFTSIDPYVVPRIDTPIDPRVTFEHKMQSLQAVSPTIWEAIGPGDLLFVDSSHVFKAGSDVEHQFMHIYPSLAAGVYVHIHDIFLPNDYPIEWNVERFQFWNEQQYLAVMLDNSDRYEVVAGLAALFDRDQSFFDELVSEFDGTYAPGSIWLRTRT